MKKIIILLIISFVCICSCKNDCTGYLKIKIEDVFSDDLKNYKSFIIIPGSGCSGCLSAAETYFKRNFDKNETLYIFTGWYSYKSLILRVGGEEILHRKNVFLDSTGVFDIQGYREGIYPYRGSIKEGKCTTVKPF